MPQSSWRVLAGLLRAIAQVEMPIPCLCIVFLVIVYGLELTENHLVAFKPEDAANVICWEGSGVRFSSGFGTKLQESV